MAISPAREVWACLEMSILRLHSPAIRMGVTRFPYRSPVAGEGVPHRGRCARRSR
jgi:hypothetical protein